MSFSPFYSMGFHQWRWVRIRTLLPSGRRQQPGSRPLWGRRHQPAWWRWKEKANSAGQPALHVQQPQLRFSKAELKVQIETTLEIKMLAWQIKGRALESRKSKSLTSAHLTRLLNRGTNGAAECQPWFISDTSHVLNTSDCNPTLPCSLEADCLAPAVASASTAPGRDAEKTAPQSAPILWHRKRCNRRTRDSCPLTSPLSISCCTCTARCCAFSLAVLSALCRTSRAVCRNMPCLGTAPSSSAKDKYRGSMLAAISGTPQSQCILRLSVSLQEVKCLIMRREKCTRVHLACKYVHIVAMHCAQYFPALQVPLQSYRLTQQLFFPLCHQPCLHLQRFPITSPYTSIFNALKILVTPISVTDVRMVRSCSV